MIDLSTWNLTVPMGTPATTIATTLVKTYKNPYFTNNGSSIVFWAPVTGSHSGASDFPRSELRETTTKGQDRSWLYTSGTNTLKGTLAVNQVPSTGKVIVAQIHAKNAPSPLVKLQYRWENGIGNVDVTYRFNPGDEKSPITYTLKNVPLNKQFNYTLQINNAGIVTVLINGAGYQTKLAPTWASYLFYFKAGDYTLDNTGYPTEGGKVTYYSLVATHP